MKRAFLQCNEHLTKGFVLCFVCGFVCFVCACVCVCLCMCVFLQMNDLLYLLFFHVFIAQLIAPSLALRRLFVWLWATQSTGMRVCMWQMCVCADYVCTRCILVLLLLVLFVLCSVRVGIALHMSQVVYVCCMYAHLCVCVHLSVWTTVIQKNVWLLTSLWSHSCNTGDSRAVVGMESKDGSGGMIGNVSLSLSLFLHWNILTHIHTHTYSGGY